MTMDKNTLIELLKGLAALVDPAGKSRHWLEQAMFCYEVNATSHNRFDVCCFVAHELNGRRKFLRIILSISGTFGIAPVKHHRLTGIHLL